jgi:hypothetical protein
MNPAQIDRLRAAVPTHVDARQRRRVDAYAAVAHRCDERIRALRTDIDRALRAVDDAVASGAGVEPAADETLRLACELDALERIQPRVDAWLRVATGAISDDPGPQPFGEGPA